MAYTIFKNQEGTADLHLRAESLTFRAGKGLRDYSPIPSGYRGGNLSPDGLKKMFCDRARTDLSLSASYQVPFSSVLYSLSHIFSRTFRHVCLD